MKNLYKFMAAGLLGIFVASCSDDEASITPADITNLRAESTPGRIVLRWETPTDAASTIEYIQVNYYDHRSKTDHKRLASIYADSIDIPDTRARYGSYDFTVKTVSPSGAFGTEQTISCISEPATPTYVSTQIQLSAEDLSTNAQESSEGPVADILDGNFGTYFHSSWSAYISGPHYIQMNLKETCSEYFRFQYVPRSNPKDAPVDFDLLGSTDGNEWFLIKNFTQEADGIPTTYSYFNSETYKIEKPFSMIRMSVNGTASYPYSAEDQVNEDIYWGPWWAICEFKIWKVKIIDPENPADDGVEE